MFWNDSKASCSHTIDTTLWSCFVQAHEDGSLKQLLSGDAEAYEYDLIVIGGGSGGLACSKVTHRLTVAI